MNDPTIGDSVRAMVRNVRRIMPGPLIIRSIVFLAGLAAMAFAMPTELLGPPMIIVGVLLAAMVTLSPGSRVVSLAQACTVIGWLLGTSMGGGLVSAVALAGLACSLYLQHTAAALAAAVPLDAVVLPMVLLRWLARILPVMLITVVAAVVVVMLPNWLYASSQLLFPLLGAASVTAVVLLLTYLALRHPRQDA